MLDKQLLEGITLYLSC